jgi:uncharacterized protein (DUF4415 family)
MWPSFVTKDLGESDDDAREMERRWLVYRDEMRALISAGGVHQDEDGWWIDDTTGELIGPDPEIERPLSEDEAARLVTLDEIAPGVALKLRRTRGRQKSERKVSTTIRLDKDVLAGWRATGAGWQTRINEVLREALKHG